MDQRREARNAPADYTRECRDGLQRLTRLTHPTTDSLALAVPRNQKGVVRVSPTDASLIVRLSAAAVTRRPGAIGSEPMRDPLVHLHCWKLLRSPRGSALRLSLRTTFQLT